MDITDVFVASGLVFFAVGISYNQKLCLEREILMAALRAVLQLSVIGFVLDYIFSLEYWPATLFMLLSMAFVASMNAAKRGIGIPRINTIVSVAIITGSVTTIGILLLFNIISFRPMEVIPISGMIIGNAMVASGLVVSRLKEAIEESKLAILTSLTLGASARQATQVSIQRAVKMGLMPNIDSMKTIGLVQLPGMMTGMILAGADPLQAVRYQILVVFMLSSTVAISSFIVVMLAYKQFFTPFDQLK